MARTININSVSRAAVIRLADFMFVEAANQGEVGIGGFLLDDASASITVPAMKAITVDESAASTTRLFTGYMHARQTQRGPNRVAGQREWDNECVDVNVLLDDYVLSGSDADRSAETDYQRVTWLLTTVFNSVGGVSAGVVPNSNTVDMDAVDYRGKRPRDVLSECAEAAGKLFFVYRFSSGPLLYYDLATGTSLSSSAKISDVAADVDNSTTWASATPPVASYNPDRIFSTVRFRYKRGTVTVSNATTLSTYRQREISIEDKSVKTSAKATAKANKFLAAAAAELTQISNVSVRLPAANVNDIRAGQRIEIKLTRHGIASLTWYRILRREVQALPGQGGASDVEYLVRLTLAANVLTPPLGGRTDSIPEETSNATDDDASVIIDRDGITITNGAITVTNGDDVVIIDGSSEIFLIAASGTLTVPQNTAKGNKFASVEVNTGLNFEPHTFWSMRRQVVAGEPFWTMPLPEIQFNNAGQVLHQWAGMARKTNGTRTTVRGMKSTSSPPLKAETLKYWIAGKAAF